MSILIVVNNPDRWPLEMPGVRVVSARSYLTDPSWSDARGLSVFNLCRSYSYQSAGYYVSLLAEARGHRPKPSVATIQDMKVQAVTRILSEEVAEVTQHSLAPLISDEFTLSIYFGRSLARRYQRLAMHLFNQFPAPLLRARFQRDGLEWQLSGIGPISASGIPESHRLFVVQSAREYFEGKHLTPRRARRMRYDLAILHDKGEEYPPSNAGAMKRFLRAADEAGLAAELIGKDDYGRLGEFDALFIRATTAVNHHTYRFARRAAAAGLVVVDDPQSIVRCANKVYLAELLERHGVPIPRTLIVHRDNAADVARELGLPVVLKQPDSAFSKGVHKVSDALELQATLDRLLDESELVVAQQFVPTEFDWRVGVFDRKPLYVCRYYMARHHWQIIHRDGTGERTFGKVDTLAVEEAPRNVVRAAVRAAGLIGKGFYGVDLKQAGRSVYVIEVNDNPNVDHGFEDRVLRQDLYRSVMQGFLERIERRKAPNGRSRA